MPKLKAIHAGGKFDVQSPDYKSRAHLITHTEAQVSHLGGKGWGVIRGAMGPRADPAIEYNDTVMTLLGGGLHPISHKEYRRDGGGMSGSLYAAVGIFDIEEYDRDLMQIVVHMPRWSHTERRATYLDGLNGIENLVVAERKGRKKPLVVRITCDWNRDLKKAIVRKEIKTQLGLNSLGWDWTGNVPKQGGTFGNKLYDGSLISLGIQNIDTYLLEKPSNPELDHTPYKSELGLHV